MCGRFVVASSPTLLAEHFAVDEVVADDAAVPDYNIAPRAAVWVVRERRARRAEPATAAGPPDAAPADAGPSRVLSRVRWGLVPSWAKDPALGDRLINARSEGIAEKPAYRRAFERHRCVIPADGFYEWAAPAEPKPAGRARKQPYFVHRRDGEPLAFAGLWEVWKVPEDRAERYPTDDGWLRSCVIVTTRANDLLVPIHDRMPVVLPEDVWGRWLDPEERDVDELKRLLVPAPNDLLELYPVDNAVGRASATGSQLVEPIGPVLRAGRASGAQ